MTKETGFGLMRYSKKTGKVDTSMTSIGTAMMSLWAMQNTTKTKACIIVDLEEGRIVERYSGTSDGFPKIEKNIEEEFVDEETRAILAEDFTNWQNKCRA